MSTNDKPTEVSNTEPSPTVPQYDADARVKIATVRALGTDFELTETRSLSGPERRIVTATPRVFVEKAAGFSEVVPGIGNLASTDSAELRDAEAYANAYGQLVDELESLTQRVRKAVTLRRLTSARKARFIYRTAKSFALLDGGDNAKTYIGEMKKALHRRRRTPEAETPSAPPVPVH